MKSGECDGTTAERAAFLRLPARLEDAWTNYLNARPRAAGPNNLSSSSISAGDNGQIAADFGAQAAKEVGDYAASKTRPYELAKLEASQFLKSLDKKDIGEADRQLPEARLEVVSTTVAAQE